MLDVASVQTGTSHVCTYGLRSNSVKQSKRNNKETNCTLNLEDSVLRFALPIYIQIRSCTKQQGRAAQARRTNGLSLTIARWKVSHGPGTTRLRNRIPHPVSAKTDCLGSWSLSWPPDSDGLWEHPNTGRTPKLAPRPGPNR